MNCYHRLSRAGLLLVVLAGLGAAGLLGGQPAAAGGVQVTPTPYPTITPIPSDLPEVLQPGDRYYALRALIDAALADVDATIDDVELALDEVDQAMADVQGLVKTGTVEVDGTTWTIDGIAAEIIDSIGLAFLWRCYLDSPLTTWILIFMVWTVVVLLIRLAMSVLPLLIQIIQFLWGLVRDVWEAIPFIG